MGDVMTTRWRGSVLARGIRLYRLLSARRLTLTEMATLTGVCERTVRRDLAALEEAHVPVVKMDTGHYRLLGD